MKHFFFAILTMTTTFMSISPSAVPQDNNYLFLGNIEGLVYEETLRVFIDLKSIKQITGESYQYTTIETLSENAKDKNRSEADVMVDCRNPKSIYRKEVRFYENGRFIEGEKINRQEEAINSEYNLGYTANLTVCNLVKPNEARLNLQSIINTSLKSSEKPQSKLPSGVYYSAGTLFNNSYREILNTNNKICIKIVDGPPNNTRGQEEITISSISIQGNKLYLDANNEEITASTGRDLKTLPVLDITEFAFGMNDGGIWEYRGNKPDTRSTSEQNKKMQECIKAKGKYIQKMKGQIIDGIF